MILEQTLFLFVARMVFFRLHESPRYLVHAGRHQEAVDSLHLISKFNGSELSLHLADVQDHVAAVPLSDEPNDIDVDTDDAHAPLMGRSSNDEEEGNSAVPPTTWAAAQASKLPQTNSSDVLRDATNVDMKSYSSMAESSTALSAHTFNTPDPDLSPDLAALRASSGARRSTSSEPKQASRQYPLPESPPQPQPRPSRRRDRPTTDSYRETKSWVYWHLPRWFRRPLWAWFDRIGMVLAPEWYRTTVLVWSAWWLMSLGTSASCPFHAELLVLAFLF